MATVEKERVLNALKDIGQIVQGDVDLELPLEELQSILEIDADSLVADDSLSDATWLLLDELGVGPRTKKATTKKASTKKTGTKKVAAKKTGTKKATKKVATKTATKEVAKKEDKPKATSKKAGTKKVIAKKTRFTRDLAVAEAIRKIGKGGSTLKEIMSISDAIFVKNGGNSNPNASTVNGYMVLALVHFGILLLKDNKYFLV